jgi:hypothetical protein
MPRPVGLLVWTLGAVARHAGGGVERLAYAGDEPQVRQVIGGGEFLAVPHEHPAAAR